MYNFEVFGKISISFLQVFTNPFLQTAFTVSHPLFEDDAFGRDERVVGDAALVVLGIDTGIAFHVVPVVPSHRMFFRGSFPNVLVVGADADDVQLLLVGSGKLAHFGDGHDARTATA